MLYYYNVINKPNKPKEVSNMIEIIEQPKIEELKVGILSPLEVRVLNRIHEDVRKCVDINSVNKLYRQGRTWNRWHTIGNERDFKTNDEYKIINAKLKEFRNEARERLFGTINR